MTLRLYQTPFCGACIRVRRLLEELDLPYETIDVGPWDRSEVRDLSGQSRVPVLVDGDTVIADSRRIIGYLVRRYGSEADETPEVASGVRGWLSRTLR